MGGIPAPPLLCTVLVFGKKAGVSCIGLCLSGGGDCPLHGFEECICFPYSAVASDDWPFDWLPTCLRCKISVSKSIVVFSLRVAFTDINNQKKEALGGLKVGRIEVGAWLFLSADQSASRRFWQTRTLIDCAL